MEKSYFLLPFTGICFKNVYAKYPSIAQGACRGSCSALAGRLASSAWVLVPSTLFILHGHNDLRLFLMNCERFRETETESLSVTMVTPSILLNDAEMNKENNFFSTLLELIYLYLSVFNPILKFS